VDWPKAHIVATRYRLAPRSRGVDVGDGQGTDADLASGPAPAPADARVVIDFAAGPYGVGPVMGFDSDDFFRPPAPETLENDRLSGAEG